ncbi:tetratricopeptide repeat protein [Streptomyces sp. NPDC046859]|uniref:tetratricopeptide repeat protein n=1 Tax=Streptomyces sp. NPDC046859 TaxID=3155734 RepID=UPI0033F0D937
MAVLTANSPEYKAIRDRLTGIEKLVHPASGTRAERGRLPGTPWHVALVETGGGSLTTATLTERVNSWLGPEAVLFVGAARVLKDDIVVGDVVVATKVYGIHGGKQTPEGFLVRPEAWRATHRLEQAARHALRGAGYRAHFKPIATGDVVLADAESAITEHVVRHYNDAVAIEMDGSGVAHAAQLNDRLGALVIRGIGGGADEGTAGRRAAEAALAVLTELDLASEPDPPGRHHGPVPIAKDSLPAPPADFTGRGDELAQILNSLRRNRRRTAQRHVLICAVSGLGGIGKTALALHAGHKALKKGWFPGGALFVDLRGYDADPVTADQAVTALLDTMGVRGTDLPPTAPAQHSLYHSRLDQRPPTLLLLDNASDPTQITPLLPGSDRHRVLITSRDKLPQLEARLLALEELSPEEAYALLDRALRIADPEDGRIRDEAEAAGKLAQLCGQLPLALRIAAALLAGDRGMPVRELVGQLTASRDRLAYLDDGARSVRAAFEVSYRRLPEERARVLRLMALGPTAETGTEALAALLGADSVPVGVLNGLVRAHLVGRGSGQERWRLHDLVREYAAGLATVEEGEAARERVLDFYHRWTNAADNRLRWLPGMPEVKLFADRAGSLAWLDAERANLVTAAQWADHDRHAETAVRLALTLAAYLDWRRAFDDWITVSRAAQRAARRTGDHKSEARARHNLGVALREAGRAREAIDAHVQARNLFQATGDRNREARAWNMLGVALREAGRTQEAIDAHTQARNLFQATGDRNREATAWTNLGLALSEAERTQEAIDAHTQARNLFQATGDPNHEALAWNNLGNALAEAGLTPEAIDAYTHALELYKEFDSWYEIGRALRNLALAHHATGNSATARTHFFHAANAFARANAPTEATEARADAEALSRRPRWLRRYPSSPPPA